MLFRHENFSGTLIVRATGTGEWNASGDHRVSLGYSIGANADTAKEGIWARWYWNGDKLTLSNDRFGFFPIFYTIFHGGIGVSTSAMELIRAGASPELDDAAISVFLRMGHYLGEDTPFKNIKTLPPGTELTWQAGRTTLLKTAVELKKTPSDLSRQESIQAYGQLFQDAVEDMLPPDNTEMVTPLSAGRDSRHILYALIRAGRIPKTVFTAKSLPPRPNTDAEMAAKITEALNLDHLIINQSTNRFGEELNKNLLTSFCADEHAHMMPVAQWLKNASAKVSWDGIGGDIISCGIYNDDRMLKQFANEDYSGLCSWLLEEEGYLPTLLSPYALKRWSRQLAEQRLTLELKKYAHLSNPAAPYFFYNIVRRELALVPFTLHNQNTHVLAPFLSHKLFDLLIDLPYEYFEGRKFHSEAIDQYYPELPQLPYHSVHTGSIPETRRNIANYSKSFTHLLLNNNKNPSNFSSAKILPRLIKGTLNQQYGTAIPEIFSRIMVLMQLEQTLQNTD